MRRGKIASGAFFSPDGLKLLLGGEAASSVVILEKAIIFLCSPSHDVPTSWARAEAIPVATSIAMRLRAESYTPYRVQSKWFLMTHHFLSFGT